MAVDLDELQKPCDDDICLNECHLAMAMPDLLRELRAARELLKLAKSALNPECWCTPTCSCERLSGVLRDCFQDAVDAYDAARGEKP